MGLSREPNADGDVLDFLESSEAREQLRGVAGRRSYDVVINCIAITSGAICRDEKKLAYAVNVQLNQILSEVFTNSKIIHLSTDSVYTKVPEALRKELLLGPKTHYASTKAMGDLVLSYFAPDYHIVRCTPVGFSQRKPAFLDWIVQAAREKREITLFRDVLFTPISLGQIGQLIVLLLRSEVTEKVINFGSDEVYTKSSFALELLEQLNLDVSCVKEVDALSVIAQDVYNGNDQRITYQGSSSLVQAIVNQNIFSNLNYDTNRE